MLLALLGSCLACAPYHRLLLFEEKILNLLAEALDRISLADVDCVGVGGGLSGATTESGGLDLINDRTEVAGWGWVGGNNMTARWLLGAELSWLRLVVHVEVLDGGRYIVCGKDL